MTFIRLLLLWPIFFAVGLTVVIWLNSLIEYDYDLRDLNSTFSFSVLTWLIAPALHWLALPSHWKKPTWIVWTMASGGVTVLIVFLVQLGFFAYGLRGSDISDPSAMDFIRWVERLVFMNAADTFRYPVGTALIPFSMAAGYLVAMAMISWTVALVHLGASIAAAIAVYFLQYHLGGIMLDLFGPAEILGVPMFALTPAIIIGLVFGLVGVLALLACAGSAPQKDAEQDLEYTY